MGPTLNCPCATNHSVTGARSVAHEGMGVLPGPVERIHLGSWWAGRAKVSVMVRVLRRGGRDSSDSGASPSLSLTCATVARACIGRVGDSDGIPRVAVEGSVERTPQSAASTS